MLYTPKCMHVLYVYIYVYIYVYAYIYACIDERSL